MTDLKQQKNIFRRSLCPNKSSIHPMPSQRLGRTLRLCLQDERKKTKPLLKEAGDKMKNPTPLITVALKKGT